MIKNIVKYIYSCRSFITKLFKINETNYFNFPNNNNNNKILINEVFILLEYIYRNKIKGLLDGKLKTIKKIKIYNIKLLIDLDIIVIVVVVVIFFIYSSNKITI